MAGAVVFVGREGELSRLLGALGGDIRLVLVTGDAGVGKTRFAGEGMARAVAGGMVVVRGECLPLAGALPLLPVAAALGEVASLDDGRVLAAALEAAPGFVRGEVGRLLPQLEPGAEMAPDERGEGWRRERLFGGVAELLDAVASAAQSGVGLVVEDVHWADSATLDFLTFLARPGRRGVVRVVVTCRSDEAPLEPQVARWLAQVRGAAGVEEITLGPLSRAEVAGQAAALAGCPVPPGVVDELFARAEGNPFFTEQLVAAALAGGTAEGGWDVPAGLPGRLAELLSARAGRCAGNARVVLNAMAVAGRPLGEEMLGDITGLEPTVVRRGLRELAAARLLADDHCRRGLIGCGMRCWLRRWLAGCCPVSGRCCTSAPPGRWKRPVMKRWPGRRRGIGRRRAAPPGNCRRGWRPLRPPSVFSATPRRPGTGSGPSSCAWQGPAPRVASAPICPGCTCGR